MTGQGSSSMVGRNLHLHASPLSHGGWSWAEIHCPPQPTVPTHTHTHTQTHTYTHTLHEIQGSTEVPCPEVSKSEIKREEEKLHSFQTPFSLILSSPSPLHLKIRSLGMKEQKASFHYPNCQPLHWQQFRPLSADASEVFHWWAVLYQLFPSLFWSSF